jgi:hypothetical protein
MQYRRNSGVIQSQKNKPDSIQPKSILLHDKSPKFAIIENQKDKI